MMSHKDNNLSIQLFYETFDQAKSKIEKLKLTRDPTAFWCKETNTIYYNSPFIYETNIPNYIIESYNNEMKKVEQEVIKYLKNKNLEDKLKKLNKLVIYLHIPIL
jgi:hypothetical protein